MSKVFLYAPGSKGRRLAEALDAARLKQFDGMDFWDRGTRVSLPDDAVIVNWARVQLDLDGPRLLNGGSYCTENSASILRHLYQIGLRTMPISFHKGAKPASDGYRWIARRWNDTFHPQLQPLSGPYWMRWLDLKKEFRLHMFNGRCIKSGEKVPQAGLAVAKTEEAWLGLVAAAHPWWRSQQSGWTVEYDGFKSTDDMRKLAKRAVAMLGLNFASVDIGQDKEGHLFIMGVNPTPVLTEYLALVYARAIKRWVENPAIDGDEETPSLPPREAPYYNPPPQVMPAVGRRVGAANIPPLGANARHIVEEHRERARQVDALRGIVQHPWVEERAAVDAANAGRVIRAPRILDDNGDDDADEPDVLAFFDEPEERPQQP